MSNHDATWRQIAARDKCVSPFVLSSRIGSGRCAKTDGSTKRRIVDLIL